MALSTRSDFKMGIYGHKIAFILGNGESRLPIKLDYLREKGVIYGCNALYRDFYPDVLVSLDEEMTKEIINAKYEGYHVHKELNSNKENTELFLVDQNGVRVTKNRGWSSGATAAFLASSCVEFKEIYLIGFDLFNTIKMNNVYKGTANYLNEFDPPIQTTQFREQLGKVMKNSPFKKFIWVNDYNKRIWLDVDNYTTMTVSEFKEKFEC